MALWSIYYADGTYAGSRNSGETAEQAVSEWNIQDNRPHFGIRYHEELIQRGTCDNFRIGRGLKADRTGLGNILLCDYRPERTPATNAIMMREVYVDAGYCRVPA